MKNRNFLTAIFAVSMFNCVDVPDTDEAEQALTAGTVTMACSPGWRASGSGAYGGVAFSISCKPGKTKTITLDGLVGQDFSIRLGAESSTTAVDCFFQGTAPDTRTCWEPPAVTMTFN